MKGYVGTLMNIPESVKMAERCVESGKQFGVDVEIVPAVWKDVAMAELAKESLTLQQYDKSYSNVGAVVGNFVAQYRMWITVMQSEEPGIILEHDAVFTDNVPNLEGQGDIINIGKPSYGNFNSQTAPGVYPMFSKPGGYIPGAHGYYLTPKGAEELVMAAENRGAAPVDMFLNKTLFPNIKEIFPWVVEARDEFTTIQNVKGCLAKHNYDKDFKVL